MTGLPGYVAWCLAALVLWALDRWLPRTGA